MATKKGSKAQKDDQIDVEYTGKKTIELIRLLIRYDIPVLLNGKSSIGKSFTIIAIGKEWKLPSQILYIGSEKSEHIEGLPKLVGLETKAQTLEYLQPYWFPREKVITQMVKTGRDLFDDFIKNNYKKEPGEDFRYSYDTLSKLLELFGFEQFPPGETTKKVILVDNQVEYGNASKIYSTEFTVEREIVESTHEEYYRDDLRDICVYLCTLLGYGNFWLILDEIDKVDISDIDKYAPLLHIVRERWLKKWKLQPINEGSGVNVRKMVKNSNYSDIKKMIDLNITAGKPLLDTRVIAIANKTSQIEEALFRRFLQVVIEELLLLRPNSIPPEEQAIKDCIDKKLGEDELKDSLTEGLDIKLISDVNLQWSFNFFPKILNMQDLQGNFIVDDYRQTMKDNTIDMAKEPQKWEAENIRLGRKTMLYKIIKDNFGGIDDGEKDDALREGLFDCLSRQIATTPIGGKSLTDLIESHIVEMMENYGNDPKLLLGEIIEKLGEAYPTIAKEDKVAELTLWVEKAMAYVTYSLFVKGKFRQSELGKILIPHIQRLIELKLTQDKDLSTDTKAAMMQNVSDYWEKLISGPEAIPLHKIQVNAEEVQKVMYGDTIANLNKVKDSEKVKLSENSIVGAGKFAKSDADTTSAYRKSLSYSLANQETASMMSVLKVYTTNLAKAGSAPFRLIRNAWKETTPMQDLKDYPGFVEYIKDNNLAYIQEQIKLWKNSKNAASIDIAKEIEDIIK